MRPLRLWVIFITSLLATLGSLYFGYFGDPLINLLNGDFFNSLNGFKICDLCRYTRIMLYPIAIISGIGLIRKDTTVRAYILPLVLIALVISIYQNIIIMMPSASSFCDVLNPCTVGYLNYLGFITIPLLAFFAEIIILAMIIRGKISRTHHAQPNK